MWCGVVAWAVWRLSDTFRDMKKALNLSARHRTSTSFFLKNSWKRITQLQHPCLTWSFCTRNCKYLNIAFIWISTLTPNVCIRNNLTYLFCKIFSHCATCFVLYWCFISWLWWLSYFQKNGFLCPIKTRVVFPLLVLKLPIIRLNKLIQNPSFINWTWLHLASLAGPLSSVPL